MAARPVRVCPPAPFLTTPCSLHQTLLARPGRGWSEFIRVVASCALWQARQGTERLGRVTAATLAQWQEHFLGGGHAALKSRPADERDDEIQRLRAKVGEIMMNNELLLERCHRLEVNLP